MADGALPARVLAFDIGGTSLRAALLAGPEEVLGVARRPGQIVQAAADRPAALERALAGLSDELGARGAGAVVLAVPGPVADGRVERLPTLFGAEPQAGVDFLALGRRLWPGARLAVCNDVTAAGYRFVADGHRDFLVATLGSGVGAKLFIEGRPLLGPMGEGGEIGHWRVPGAAAWACDCGGRGHLGAQASGRGALQVAQHLARRAPKRFGSSLAGRLSGGQVNELTAQVLAQAACAGDGWAISALTGPAKALGSAFALIHLATGVGSFFLAGGFAAGCGEALRLLIARAAQRHGWATGLDWNRAIVSAEAGREDGLIGAGVIGRRLLAGEPTCA